MFMRDGLERVLVSVAVLLSLFPTWHAKSIFFTVSDLVFCLTLLTILLSRGLPIALFGFLTPYWMAGFTLLMVSLVGSSLINGDPMRAFVVCAQYMFSFVLLPLAIMGRGKEATINLIQIFAAGTFVVNLASIILYYAGYSGDFQFVTGNGRLASFAGGPNANAHMIALACPLVIYLWLSGRMATYYIVPLLLVLLVALVLTSLNGGIAMTVLSMSAFLIVLRELRYLVRVAAGLAICLVLIAVSGSYWLPETFEQRVLGAVRSGSMDEAGTFQDRVALMEEALEMLDENLLIGLGVDQYQVLSQYGAPVHNTYLLLWVEGGLPALIGWICLLAIPLVGSVLVAKRQRLVAATGFAVGTVFALMGLTGAHMYARHGYVPLHLAMALVFAVAAEAGARSARHYRPAEDAHHPIPQKFSGAGSPPELTARPAPPRARW